jgi:hypothetical protein
MKQLATYTPLLIKRYQFNAESIDEIIKIVTEYTKENDFEIEIIERNTKNGFYMKLHRDDYRFDINAYKRGIRNESLWIPIYGKKRPIYTVIWYQSTQGIDFIGGNLRFFDGYTIKPKRNSAILFDSNDLHEVTLQQTKDGVTNERKTIIIKFYNENIQ